jgi:hypothetical protein
MLTALPRAVFIRSLSAEQRSGNEPRCALCSYHQFPKAGGSVLIWLLRLGSGVNRLENSFAKFDPKSICDGVVAFHSDKDLIVILPCPMPNRIINIVKQAVLLAHFARPFVTIAA